MFLRVPAGCDRYDRRAVHIDDSRSVITINSEKLTMANVLGQPGRYLSEQSVQKFQRIILLFILFGVVDSFLCGYMLASKQIYLILILIIALPFAYQSFKKRANFFEKERANYHKGLLGEAAIAYILDNFPDDYRVIHDLKTPYGYIDHVVIGTSGVYVIDSKNWRGVVAADGSGRLLINGKPTDKPKTKNLTRTVMNVREKVKGLCGLDPYMQGVMAFPSALVEAKWGSTGAVHCMTDEALYDYVVHNNRGNKLTKKEVDVISRAFLALAHMGKRFE
jgi:hypothetical protein